MMKNARKLTDVFRDPFVAAEDEDEVTTFSQCKSSLTDVFRDPLVAADDEDEVTTFSQ